MSFVALVACGGKQVSPATPYWNAPWADVTVDLAAAIPVITDYAASCESTERVRASNEDGSWYDRGGPLTHKITVDRRCNEVDYERTITCSSPCKVDYDAGRTVGGARRATVRFTQPGDHRIDVSVMRDGEGKRGSFGVKVRKATHLKVTVQPTGETVVRVMGGDDVLRYTDPEVLADRKKLEVQRRSDGSTFAQATRGLEPVHLEVYYRDLYAEVWLPAAPSPLAP